jgi:hypothetical protein
MIKKCPFLIPVHDPGIGVNDKSVPVKTILMALKRSVFVYGMQRGLIFFRLVSKTVEE